MRGFAIIRSNLKEFVSRTTGMGVEGRKNRRGWEVGGDARSGPGTTWRRARRCPVRPGMTQPLLEPGGPDGPVDDSGDGQGHRGEDQEDPEVGGELVAPEAEVELFVDPVVVLLCEELEVGVPGREEDLAGVGGGDKLDGEGREFVLLFPEGRVRVGVVLHLVV